MVGLIAIGGLVLVAIIMFTKPGVLIKGFAGLFVKNMAQTPEGANAIYEEAINKTQDKYNDASNALQRISGQLQTYKDKLADAQKRLNNCESKCESLIAMRKDEEAMYFAEERENILLEVEQYSEAVKELEPIYKEAMEIKQYQEKELKKLKAEQKTVVDNLKRNIQVKEMYDAMDELKRNSNLDKMMGYVKDGATEKREMAVGARTEYESRLSTKLERANTEASKASSTDYIAKLKAKHSLSTEEAFEVKEKINNKV